VDRRIGDGEQLYGTDLGQQLEVPNVVVPYECLIGQHHRRHLRWARSGLLQTMNGNICQNGGYGVYSFTHGEVFYNISSIGCGTVQAFSQYWHTWSSTGINGIGVGPWSFTVSWSSEGHDWPQGSQPSNAVTPC
jgi:hypothetical protein